MAETLTEIKKSANPERRDRTFPRVIKRGRHNAYLIKRPHHKGQTHTAQATIHIRALTPPQAA